MRRLTLFSGQKVSWTVVVPETANHYHSLVSGRHFTASQKSAQVVRLGQEYFGAPYADMVPARRSRIFGLVAKEHDEHNGSHADAQAERPAGIRDGLPMSKGSPCQWLRKQGRRSVRVKAAHSKFHWDNRRWLLSFQGLDFELDDVFILIVYAPWGLDLWEYAKQKGPGTTTCVRGSRVQIYGKVGETSLDASWYSRIRPRLVEIARHLAFVGWSDSLLNGACLDMVTSGSSLEYADVPLAKLSPAKRGCVLEYVARRYDAKLLPSSYRVCDPLCGRDTAGRRLGRGKRPYDWLRLEGGSLMRVEAKSSSIRWDGARWLLQFSSIKLWHFDLLLLIVYAPWGLEVWEYDLARKVGLHGHGKHTSSLGHRISICGPRGEKQLSASWLRIRSRLEAAGKSVCGLAWGDPFLTECLQLEGARSSQGLDKHTNLSQQPRATG